MRRLIIPFASLWLVALAGAGPAERPIDYARDIQPLLSRHCAKCHGPEKAKSGYRLDRREPALKGGDSGEAAIVPGKGLESSLIARVTSDDADFAMPPKEPRLTAEQVELLRTWIDQGARWDGANNTESEAAHWSLQALKLPVVPRAADERWGRNPIDAFILAKLDEKGLKPSPEADRPTLLRRLSFDLTGLPPTPEEIDAFVADPSADAYLHVVDRLLASPRYGERWARHWMDVVHFAETHGNDQDRPRPNAWPYRDYLIEAFNDDKPYNRFVQEQIAGDALFPGDSRAIVALGFLAAGPWDESSQRDIKDDTIDKQIARNLDRDDMVATTFSTFQSATVHCARCHNHKFDPITQREYYSLQAIFAGVDRAERPYGVDPRLESLRQPLLAKKTALESRQPAAVEAVLSLAERAELAADQAEWERNAGKSPVLWTALVPVSVTSSGGATPAVQPDHSIRFGGLRPETDTYTIVAETELRGITAVRLEVLTDASLPLQGPGRQDNGNLHLTEFQVKAAPRSQADTARILALRNPSADFNQEGWTINLAIDGQPRTAWGIYPAVGKPHQAVFEIQEPTGFAGGTRLTFVLEQNHGGGHLIGRARLAVTDAPRPVRADALPDPIVQILAIAKERRSAAQNADLAAHFYANSPLIRTHRERVSQQLASLPEPPLVYAAAHDFKPEGSFSPAKTPRPIHVLKRGDINNPGELVEPGTLACVPGLNPRFTLPDPNDEAARRVVPRWITDSDNVLTWRSIANRIWHYHFGRGLVDSPNDLGRMGARPTHPELLDWLAVTFRDGGGSLKNLHRLIVTSATYRQSSQQNEQAARVDADNLYLWRMNRVRLDAESVRDAVLQVSGKLDLTMGGPSVKQFIQKPGIHVTPVVDYDAFDVDSPASCRRSVYRFLFRTLPDPFMESMDCPDASQFSPKRNTSVTVLQALAMLNDRFIVRQSEHFAERAEKGGQDLDSRIALAYRLALGRASTPNETQAFRAFVAKHGMASACRLILNCNEFLFIN